MSFASRLKEQRVRMGLTQMQLADALGVSKGAVGNYEIGTSSPKAENLYQLFNILQCDANYLFQDEMRELRNNNATPYEMENIIKKYRTLDGYGKDAVHAILDVEYNRCATASEPEEASQTYRVAARGGPDTITLTESDKKIMKDDIEKTASTTISDDVF